MKGGVCGQWATLGIVDNRKQYRQLLCFFRNSEFLDNTLVWQGCTHSNSQLPVGIKTGLTVTGQHVLVSTSRLPLLVFKKLGQTVYPLYTFHQEHALHIFIHIPFTSRCRSQMTYGAAYALMSNNPQYEQKSIIFQLCQSFSSPDAQTITVG